MKILIISLLFSLSTSLAAQNKVIGRYRDHFGNRIQFNADNTFKYTWNFDLASSWTTGTWTLQKDTLYLTMIPIYDTLSQKNSNGLIIDTFILSSNEIAERITPTQSIIASISGGGQNRMPHPDKFFFKKEQLYMIQNGNLVVNKQRGFGTGTMYDPWYFKSDD